MDHFEDLVQHRQIREKGKPRKISDRRRGNWIRSANALLDNHSVEELRATLDWLFTHRGGSLPFQVVNEWTGRIDHRERRVTRLAQILDHYQELRCVMDSGELPPGTPPMGVEDTTMPRGFYDRGGRGFAVVEDQVNVLVELFTKTRRRPVSDFDLFAWRKTFRIMLTHRQIPYDDIHMVVEALGDTRLQLDRGRYHSPYDLHRDGEWEHVLASVKVALLREQNSPIHHSHLGPDRAGTTRRSSADDPTRD